MSITLTPAQAIAQQAAELLWSCATCEDHAVASYRSPVYLAAEQAFEAAAKQAYGLTGPEWGALRDLLSELGPQDSARDTDGWGIYSYVQLAHRQVAEAHAEAVAADVCEAYPVDTASTGPDPYAEWVAAKAGQEVALVLLADAQVGAYVRALGWGWTVRPASWVVTPGQCELVTA